MESVFRKVWLVLSPTYPQCELTFNLDDYGKRQSITMGLTSGGNQQRRKPPSLFAIWPSPLLATLVIFCFLYHGLFKKICSFELIPLIGFSLLF